MQVRQVGLRMPQSNQRCVLGAAMLYVNLFGLPRGCKTGQRKYACSFCLLLPTGLSQHTHLDKRVELGNALLNRCKNLDLSTQSMPSAAQLDEERLLEAAYAYKAMSRAD